VFFIDIKITGYSKSLCLLRNVSENERKFGVFPASAGMHKRAPTAKIPEHFPAAGVSGICFHRLNQSTIQPITTV
jgi:hypothetical protein